MHVFLPEGPRHPYVRMLQPHAVQAGMGLAIHMEIFLKASPSNPQFTEDY